VIIPATAGLFFRLCGRRFESAADSRIYFKNGWDFLRSKLIIRTQLSAFGGTS